MSACKLSGLKPGLLWYFCVLLLGQATYAKLVISVHTTWIKGNVAENCLSVVPFDESNEALTGQLMNNPEKICSEAPNGWTSSDWIWLLKMLSKWNSKKMNLNCLIYLPRNRSENIIFTFSCQWDFPHFRLNDNQMLSLRATKSTELFEGRHG